jgi:hypothetical protein
MIPRTNPTEAAAALATAPSEEVGPMTVADSVSVAIGASPNGWFTLYWTSAAPNTWDWIGLYPSDATPDTGFVTGQNWQWATEGKPELVSVDDYYVTNTSLKPSGYQARYLSWDSSAGIYRSIVRTPAFVGKVCA